MTTRARKPKPVVGWREWVALPEFADAVIKTKIDTGARTSALHAFGLSVDKIDGKPVATFELHPVQRSDADLVVVKCPVLTFRRIRSSNGKVELRPIIATTARIGGSSWPIEVSLTSRDAMGFRMLLGRSAIRRRFLVDPGRSFVLSRSEGSD